MHSLPCPKMFSPSTAARQNQPETKYWQACANQIPVANDHLFILFKIAKKIMNIGRLLIALLAI
jgi:hypothetical protein